jgi:hypothetical protein
VEAGLPGAGLVLHQVVDLPLGHEALGKYYAAVRGSCLAPFELEAADGYPRFDQFRAGVHCQESVNVTAGTDQPFQV